VSNRFYADFGCLKLDMCNAGAIYFRSQAVDNMISNGKRKILNICNVYQNIQYFHSDKEPSTVMMNRMEYTA